jgi:hypothetical protein
MRRSSPPSRQGGVAHHRPGEPVGKSRQQAQADQASPVLSEERDLPQVVRFQPRAHPIDVAFVGVVRLFGRFVGFSEAYEVQRDDPVPASGQTVDHTAVEERSGRLAVEQQNGPRVTGAMVYRMNADWRSTRIHDGRVGRLESVVRQGLESSVSRSQHLHKNLP